MTENAVRRVFILEDNERFDTSSTESFGPRIYLNPQTSPFNPDSFVEELYESLNKYLYDPDKDYIAIVGPVQALALYIGALMAEYAPVDLLLYHAPSGLYQAKQVGSKYETTNDTKLS